MVGITKIVLNIKNEMYFSGGCKQIEWNQIIS